MPRPTDSGNELPLMPPLPNGDGTEELRSFVDGELEAVVAMTELGDVGDNIFKEDEDFLV